MAIGTTLDSALDRDVRDLIYRTSLLLDRRDFLGWLNLCAPEFQYSVTAYSPEIRKEMIWLDHNRDEMVQLVRLLPQHNSDPSPLTRHISVYTVAYDADVKRAEVITSFVVFRTNLDGGATELFAVGKYYDTVAVGPEHPRFLRREVRLDTRDLGIGTHLPL